MHFFQHPYSFLLSSLSILLSNLFSNTISVSWILPKLRKNCHLRVQRVLLSYHAALCQRVLMSTQLQLSQQQSFLSVLLISIFKVLYTYLIGFSNKFCLPRRPPISPSGLNFQCEEELTAFHLHLANANFERYEPKLFDS